MRTMATATTATTATAFTLTSLTLATATAVAVLSISSCASAFQALPLATFTRSSHVSTPTSTSTQQWVATDPNILLMEDLKRLYKNNGDIGDIIAEIETDDSKSEQLKESLEHMFSTSPADFAPPMLDAFDNKTTAKTNTALPTSNKSTTSSSTTKRAAAKRTVNATNKRTRKKRKSPTIVKAMATAVLPLSSPLPSRQINPTSSTKQSLPTHDTVTLSTNTQPLPQSQPQPKRISRSSTMPGFTHRNKMGKQKAFEDGVKMVELRTGKKYIDTKLARKTRRKKNSDTMYKTSASVPDSMMQFAAEIHNEDRITPNEEIELGTLTQEAIRLQSLHDNLVQRLEREPSDQEWCAEAGKINMEALEQALQEGLEAKNKLVTANLRMVQGVVNIYIRNGLGGQYNAGDMMQEGTMALIRAAEKFEPERGFRFSTYAMYWIRSAVKRSQIFQSRVITVPQRLYENHKRIQRVEKELKQSLNREASPKELGAAVNMSVVQLDRCRTAMDQRIFSLDDQINNKNAPNNGDRNQDTMYELVDHKSSDNGDYNQVQKRFMRQDLIEALYRHLSPLDVDLVLLRFGLMDERTLPHGFGGPLTIAEVSRLVGLKPDKVRRMINSSLKQLKFLIANEWEDFERQLEALS